MGKEALTKEELTRIRRVQLKMDRLATDLLAGMYRSRFKGRGMEFEEVREFQPGDEIRSVDWNVTARMGTPFVKQFREERELTVYLMLDISGSLNFRSTGRNKRDVLSEIGAVLTFSGIKNQDKIGLILFSDRIEHHLPPKKGVRHALRLIRDLLAFPATGKKTDFEKAFLFLSKVQKKKCILFVFSDFIGGGEYQNALAVLGKTHDIIAIAIDDPLENHIPDIGLIAIKDLETDEERVLDTGSKEVEKALFEARQKGLDEAKSRFKKIGAAFTVVKTTEPYLKPLKQLFTMRMK